MANDPYAPPGSAVDDVVPERMLRERPPQIVRAVLLLWTSFALALPLVYLDVERAPEGTAAAGVAVWAVLLGLGAALNVQIWRGANWARIVYLALFAISFLALWFTAAEMLEKSVFEFVLNAANAMLDAFAMYLLFTRPGSLWFRKAAP